MHWCCRRSLHRWQLRCLWSRMRGCRVRKAAPLCCCVLCCHHCWSQRCTPNLCAPVLNPVGVRSTRVASPLSVSPPASCHRSVTDLFHARMKRDPTPPALSPPSQQPCWPRLRAHASFQANREWAHPDVGWRELGFWSWLLASLRACFPPLRRLERLQVHFGSFVHFSNTVSSARTSCTR